MLNKFEEGISSTNHKVCPALGIQEIEIGVPVEIKPFVEVFPVRTRCMGSPMIKPYEEYACKSKDHCKFSINQKIRVEVPIICGAVTEVGEMGFECGLPCSRCACEDENQ